MQNTALVDAYGCKLFVYFMTFGEWLRETIKEKGGISNAELARRTGLSPTYIGNLIRDYSPNTKKQRGRPSEEVVENIARALNVSIDDARIAAGYAPAQPEISEASMWFFREMSELTPEQQQRVMDFAHTLIAGIKNEGT